MTRFASTLSTSLSQSALPFSRCKRAGFILLLSGALLGGNGTWAQAAPTPAAPSGEALLRAMIKAQRSASFSGTEVTQSGGRATKVRLWRQGLKRRLEFVEPPVRLGDLLVDDGSNVWLYHRVGNSAVQTKSAAGTENPGGGERMIRRGVVARVKGAATVAGRRAWIVEVTPRGKERPLRRLWIDRATKVRLRVERFTSGGRRVESATLSNVRFGPVPAARFEWTPPPGVAVTRTAGTLFTQLGPARRAASWLQYPRVTPPGYVFESAIVDEARGEAWLRYTNGLRRFSIFQQRAESPESGGEPGDPRSVDGGWYWQRAGSRLLGVDIPPALVDQVTRSVR